MVSIEHSSSVAYLWLTISFFVLMSHAQGPPQPAAAAQPVAGFNTAGSYFPLRATHELASERIDPIISPGISPSNHVHDVFGASVFSSDWTYDKAIRSRCSNLMARKDHSNYWAPALYHHSASDEYERVPSHFSVYYHFETQPNGKRTMFPPGFKIVAGDPHLRSDGGEVTKGIEWYCHGPEQKSVGKFPDGVTSCDNVNGFSVSIWMPFCWDGIEDFDPKNPGAHVVYGNSDGPIGGTCTGPAGKHTTPLPQLQMEYHHNVQKWADVPGHETGKWVLATGDPTGWSMHADFINGWEPGPRSLEDAMQPDLAKDPSGATTACMVGLGGTPGREAEQCFDLTSQEDADACVPDQVSNEEVTRQMKQLPGCNPLQLGPQPAVMQDSSCGGGNAGQGSGETAGNLTQRSLNEEAASLAAGQPMTPVRLSSRDFLTDAVSKHVSRRYRRRSRRLKRSFDQPGSKEAR